MSDAVKFAFLQATAPLCPDVQRKIWIWKEIMEGIGIYNHYDEGLTWYSLRHFAIHKKIDSGIPIIDLSKIVGTTVDNIEKVYRDYNKEMSRSAALKTFKKNDDGSISQLSRLEM